MQKARVSRSSVSVFETQEITNMIKINIGCGPVGHPDWINIDYGILALLHKYAFLEKTLSLFRLWPAGYDVQWPPNLMVHDCRKGLPFAPETVDYIYTSHFLEHLRVYETRKVLASCYEGLRKGGVLRIVLPDIDLIVDQYRKGHDRALEAVNLDKHFYSMPGADNTSDPGLKDRFLSIFMRPHQWLYNFPLLEKNLVETGFDPENIRQLKYKEGETPDIHVLDAYPEISMYVEAKK